MIFTISLQLYALGSYPSAFSQNETVSFQTVLNSSFSFISITIPWSLNYTPFEPVLKEIILSKRCPIIIWDPILPRNYPDSVQATLNGMNDEYINGFYLLIKKMQIEQAFTPIIVIGQQINTGQQYSNKLFPDLYRYVVIKGNGIGAKCKYAFSIDPKDCTEPQNVVIVGNKCSQKWIFNETSQQLEECVDTADIIILPNLTVNNETNPFSKLNCTRNASEYYPGDSYVDWIILHIVNEDAFRPAATSFHIGMALADTISKSKPLMIFAGSISAGGDKNQFILDMKTYADLYSKRGKYNYQTIKGVVLINKENNKDIGLYDSIHGNLVSSITNNGVQLYTYNAIVNLFNQSQSIKENVNILAAAMGSICGPGETADLTFPDCKPCQTGTYQPKSGQLSCLLCDIGYYQDETGSEQCTICGNHSTTIAQGTQRAEYCVCVNNYAYGSKGCELCHKNYYSRNGDGCIPCPTGYQFKGSYSAPGCFCLKGYHWDSSVSECLKGASTDGVTMISSAIIISIGLVFMVIM
ncbi:Putative_ephrin-receptor like protein [Hexamita inflata]|uniref:Putative_ephrin-receptor like protein n=1 Tax=Hexamita inflata TaxID=28002 RepID=A0ABP1HGJ3_9EUKA